MKTNLNLKFLATATFLMISAGAINGPTTCQAQSSSESVMTSDPQKLARGLGHFERARSLLLAAIREFDSGYKYVKTDQVLDSEAWRKTLLSRSEELETILSPKPRELKAGSNYQPDTRLLGAKVKPSKNLKSDQVVSPEIPNTIDSNKAEAKTGKEQTNTTEELDLGLGS